MIGSNFMSLAAADYFDKSYTNSRSQISLSSVVDTQDLSKNIYCKSSLTLMDLFTVEGMYRV